MIDNLASDYKIHSLYDEISEKSLDVNNSLSLIQQFFPSSVRNKIALKMKNAMSVVLHLQTFKRSHGNFLILASFVAGTPAHSIQLNDERTQKIKKNLSVFAISVSSNTVKNNCIKKWRMNNRDSTENIFISLINSNRFERKLNCNLLFFLQCNKMYFIYLEK